MCFKQVHVFNMFVLKVKSRLITDKNIFALCFKEYLKRKKKKEVSLVMIIGSSHGPDFASLSQKRADRVYLPWFVSICSVRNAKVRVNLESNATTE